MDGRHNSNHNEPAPIHIDRLSNNVCVAAESTLPKTLAQKYRWIAVRPVFFRQKSASKNWLKTENFEKVSKHSSSKHALWFTAITQIKTLALPRREAFKGIALIPPLSKITGRRGID